VALKADSAVKDKTIIDLKSDLKDSSDKLNKAEHPFFPDWAIFAIGFAVGAFGLHEVTK
jgi:hypothetical protein